MHAVVVKATINDRDAAEAMLQDQVVPRVKQAPGFVSGTWTRKDGAGLSMVVFESEEAASTMSEQVRSMVSDAVSIEEIEVREVVVSV